MSVQYPNLNMFSQHVCQMLFQVKMVFHGGKKQQFSFAMQTIAQVLFLKAAAMLQCAAQVPYQCELPALKIVKSMSGSQFIKVLCHLFIVLLRECGSREYDSLNSLLSLP